MVGDYDGASFAGIGERIEITHRVGKQVRLYALGSTVGGALPRRSFEGPLRHAGRARPALSSAMSGAPGHARESSCPGSVEADCPACGAERDAVRALASARRHLDLVFDECWRRCAAIRDLASGAIRSTSVGAGCSATKAIWKPPTGWP